MLHVPRAVVARLLDAVPTGSYLALTHVGTELFDVEMIREGEEIARRMSQAQVRPAAASR
jgi:S-adenosyl methyltransferase